MTRKLKRNLAQRRGLICKTIATPQEIEDATGDINIRPSPVCLSPTAIQRRSFFQRTFSKLEKGSVRGSIFNLVSSALGGGVLSLSYVFVLSGWLTGIVLITVGAIAAAWSNLLIIKVAKSQNICNLDQMAYLAGGDFLRKFLQIMMLINAFGCCIGYQIFMSQLLSYA